MNVPFRTDFNAVPQVWVVSGRVVPMPAYGKEVVDIHRIIVCDELENPDEEFLWKLKYRNIYRRANGCDLPLKEISVFALFL